MASPRWDPARQNAAVAAFNQFYIPLARALRGLRTDGLAKARVEHSRDHRVYTVTVEIKHVRKPWTLVVYVTTQELRPLSPRDVARILRRLAATARRAAEAAVARDVTMLIVAAGARTRATRGARRLLAGAKILMLQPRRVISFVAGYFWSRLHGLLRKLRAAGLDPFEPTLEEDKVLRRKEIRDILTVFQTLSSLGDSPPSA